MPARPESDYEWLELLYQVSPSLPAGHSLRRFFGTVWCNLVEGISLGFKQPEVHQFFDSQGLPLWYIYDPVTKQSFVVTSEQEMMEWLRNHC